MSRNNPNMSYCMYENTLAALNQLYYDLEEAVDDCKTITKYRKELSSEEERRAFDEIRDVMQDIIEHIKELEYNDDEVDTDEDDV